ncbi:ParB/RepB/Spo0J family partition protein [Streptomyces sp. NBC_01433]|uniref:ParB/RepB/Spo0J family partition protein n=1 Tax=Streptomyces sp. NBC_01433 TaxID=2903864 RepID=UPI00225971FA|nr:ParB/RepB/Spo0J family partition protein [Streptomyces sp. NBC_01433]MCX4681770.1 ParB/RepB/Spo0J family partition protein [Streptomyces sp. NBC_01433]
MSKADKLGAGASFGQARAVSARRAAIGAATGAPTTGVPNPTELPVGVISQNPDNPRDHLRDLEGMAESVQELGVVNAITVAAVEAYLRERPDRAADLDEGATYIVIDGHRRLEGARRAGLKTIKVQVDNARVATDEALLEAAFVSNVQRDNMTDLEQAHALDALVTFYGSQTKASKRLGLSQASISSKLSLLKLAPDLQAELVTGERQVEHVRNLGKLSPEEQRAAADARASEAARRRRRSKPASTAEPAADYHAVIIRDDRPTGEPASSGDYHGVIIADTDPTGATDRDMDYHAVIIRDEESVGEPTGEPDRADDYHAVIIADTEAPDADPSAPALPSQPGNHETTSGARDAAAGGGVPWHDPVALAAMICAHMPYQERTRLTLLLAEKNRAELKG